VSAKPVLSLDLDARGEPAGFRELLKALAEFLDLRADGSDRGPTIKCRDGVVTVHDGITVHHGSAVVFPHSPMSLDHLAPMPPFLRERARRIRGLPSPLVVDVDAPTESVEVASLVLASAEALDRDVVTALALGSVTIVAAEVATRLGLVDGVQAIVGHGEQVVDEFTAAALSRRASDWARRTADPRHAAVRIVEQLGLHRWSPSTAVRHACVELHSGRLSRVDARLARLVGDRWD
jgi:hypothetical protein